MKLRAAARTDKGLLPSQNEDRYLARHDLGLYAVADGIGGLEAGEVASSVACRTLEEAIEAAAGAPLERRDLVLREAVSRCNQAVLAVGERRDDRRGVGSTLVALWFLGDRALFAGVGDSRVFLFRDGTLRQLTRDAKAGRFRLAASLGQGTEVRPQLGMVRLKPADRFLLSTDGLHGLVAGQEIARILDEEVDSERCCERLVKAAYEAGGEDNVTVVVADVVEPDPAQPWRFSHVHRDATSRWPWVVRLVGLGLLAAAVVLGLGVGLRAWLARPGRPVVTLEAPLPAPVALAVQDANERAAADDRPGMKAALRDLVRAAVREKAVLPPGDLGLAAQAAAALPQAAQEVWSELYAPAGKHLAEIVGTPAEPYVGRELEVTRERIALVRQQFLARDYRHVAETFATLADEVETIAQRGWREFRQEREALAKDLEALRAKGKLYPRNTPIRRRLEELVAEARRALDRGDLPRARRSIEAARRVLLGEAEPR